MIVLYRALGNLVLLGALLLGHQAFFGTPEKWNFAFVVLLLLSIIGVIFTTLCVHDSPEDLIYRNRMDEARTILELYQGTQEDVPTTEHASSDSLTDMSNGKYSYRQLLPVFGVAVAVTLASQRMGSREFYQYSTMIFR